jgi:hypothetical protein
MIQTFFKIRQHIKYFECFKPIEETEPIERIAAGSQNIAPHPFDLCIQRITSTGQTNPRDKWVRQFENCIQGFGISRADNGKTTTSTTVTPSTANRIEAPRGARQGQPQNAQVNREQYPALPAPFVTPPTARQQARTPAPTQAQEYLQQQQEHPPVTRYSDVARQNAKLNQNS